MCPSDTYKIWKKGTNVRVDTSLVGFENMQWLRGNQSFIFQVTGIIIIIDYELIYKLCKLHTHTHTYNYVFVGEGAKLTEIDHDKMSVWEHPFKLTG